MAGLTAGSRWKMTTLPPLSPVARRSPSWLNSTQEIMSAVGETEKTQLRSRKALTDKLKG